MSTSEELVEITEKVLTISKLLQADCSGEITEEKIETMEIALNLIGESTELINKYLEEVKTKEKK